VGVVDRLEDALLWIKKEEGFKTLVTLEGDMVERSGVISGGSHDQGLGILERRREIKDLEKKIGEGRRSAERRKKKRISSGGRLQEGKTSLNTGRERFRKRRSNSSSRKRLEGLNKEISQFRQRMEVLQFEQKQLEEENQEIEREKRKSPLK